jgi:nucleotidyltransferase/DNA polymerase involved in DNA repair
MPLVLVGQAGRRREVVAANAAAIRIGLRVGMPATKAQALVKELVIHHADPAADGEALERLAVWALRYSPVVAIDGPDGLVIDATGASHLHGGEDAILADMISRLESVGITARAAMADTRGAAHALARFAAQSSLVIPERESAERIKPLPIAALRLTADMVDDLGRLGFERVIDAALSGACARQAAARCGIGEATAIVGFAGPARPRPFGAQARPATPLETRSAPRLSSRADRGNAGPDDQRVYWSGPNAAYAPAGRRYGPSSTAAD